MKPSDRAIVFLICLAIMATWFWWVAASRRLPVEEAKPPPTFLSATECIGADGKPAHGTWRWLAKVDPEQPPIFGAQPVTIADMASWPVPTGPFDKDTSRQGMELEWFELTSTVVLAKAEADGDVHLQLSDGDVQVVVEVPLGPGWTSIRQQVFAWADDQFPFQPKELTLNKHPRIRVVGRCFFDLYHQGDIPGRRSYEPGTLIAEIHPVMRLEELP